MSNPTQDKFPDLPVGKFAVTNSAGVEYNAATPFPTTATISGDVNIDSTSIDTSGLIGKPSGGDFTTAYLAATTITLGTYPDGTSITHDDIVTVVQIATAGTVTATYSRDDVGMSVAANVLTVAGASFAASDSFVIYTNVPRYVSGAGVVGAQVQRVTLPSDVALPAGTNAIGKLSANSGIDIGDVDVTSIIPGTGATSLGKAIDSAAGATDTAVPALFIRDDALSALTPIEGDWTPGRVDSIGSLWVTLSSLLAGEDLINNAMQVILKPVAVNTYTPTRDSSTALEASSISKATAGNLYRAFGGIDATAATDIYYIQFLDAATLTADGAVTHLITPIPVNHTINIDSTFDTGDLPFGVAAANGIVIVVSTTMVLKTIAGSIMFATTLIK